MMDSDRRDAMLNEGLFPGNTQAYSKLRDRLATESVMTFVGSGASIPMYPSWTGLLRKLLSASKQAGIVTEQDDYEHLYSQALSSPLQCANHLEDFMQVATFRSALREEFKTTKQFTDCHRAIIRLKAKAHLTLNYDDGLERAYTAVTGGTLDSIRYSDQYEIENWAKDAEIAKSSVVHWHGVPQAPREMIFTGRDYDEMYKAGSTYLTTMGALWRQQSLLIIGFGFSDPFLTRVARESLRQLSSGNIHTAFIGVVEGSSVSRLKRAEFTTDYRLDPIFYSVRIDPDTNRQDHSDLVGLLDLLASDPPGSGDPTSTERHVQPSALKLDADSAEKSPIEDSRSETLWTPAHRAVRTVERTTAQQILSELRVMTLQSDWGLASDDFLSSLYGESEAESLPLYVLDLHKAVDRASFFAEIQAVTGKTYEAFCEALKSEGRCFLVLDDLRLLESDWGTKLRNDFIKSVVDATLDFCPDVLIVLSSRQRIRFSGIEGVELGAFDEAEMITYSQVHAKAHTDSITPEMFSSMYRQTAGIPIKVDIFLDRLQFVSFEQIQGLENTDITAHRRGLTPPHSLVLQIDELSKSEDKEINRAYLLLKVLTVFPQGELIERIRNMVPNTPVLPDHANILQRLGLLKVRENQNAMRTDRSEPKKVSHMPALVSSYISSLMSIDEVRDLQRFAAKIYSGDRWLEGRIQTGQKFNFSDPFRDSFEIGNAGKLICDLIRQSLEKSDSRLLEATMNVASNLMSDLIEGHHYHSAVSIGLSLQGLYPLPETRRRAYLSFQIGRSYRMMGLHVEAQTALEEVRNFPFANSVRQSVLLNIILSKVALRDLSEAPKYIREIIEIDPSSAFSLHAKALRLELEPRSPERTRKLVRLENYAKRQKAVLVANNIALVRAEEDQSNDPDHKLEILEGVIDRARDFKDFYNHVRASIHIAKAKMSAQGLPDGELRRMIQAYHYLFDERVGGLFDEAHDIMWEHFLAVGNSDSLFRLFRLSSFAWRTRDNFDKERLYATKMLRAGIITFYKNLLNVDPDEAYCSVRIREIVKG